MPLEKYNKLYSMKYFLRNQKLFNNYNKLTESERYEKLPTLSSLKTYNGRKKEWKEMVLYLCTNSADSESNKKNRLSGVK